MTIKNNLFFTTILMSFFFLLGQSLIAQNARTHSTITQDNDFYEDSVTYNTFDEYDIENPIAFSMPIKQYLRTTSEFGRRSKHRWHYGIDLRIGYRDSIMNAWNGVVESIGYEPRGYGRYVEIKHFNGFTTIYAHLDSVLVQVGDSLLCASPVGLGGRTGRATGVHLHFEIRYNGKPFDPKKIIDFPNGQLKSSFLASLKKDQPTNYLKKIEVKVYRVRSGDTISRIAQRHDVKISTLYKLNGFLAKSKYLKVGQLIRYQ